MVQEHNKALFLDRDGVINIDSGYVYKSEDCVFVSGIFDLVRCAKELGYVVLIITNQAGVGRGYYAEGDFHQFMDWLLGEFLRRDCCVDGYYACYTHPEAKISQFAGLDYRRKPGPGMLFEAAAEHNISLSDSLMVGDKLSDVLAGLHAGVAKTFLLSDQQLIHNFPRSVSIVNSLSQIKRYLVSQ